MTEPQEQPQRFSSMGPVLFVVVLILLAVFFQWLVRA